MTALSDALEAAQLCSQRGVEPPDMAGVNRVQAGEIIDSLKNGSYDASKWTVPF